MHTICIAASILTVHLPFHSIFLRHFTKNLIILVYHSFLDGFHAWLTFLNSYFLMEKSIVMKNDLALVICAKNV